MKKRKLSGHDRCMVIFRIMLLTEDLHDIFAFLIQLRVLRCDRLLPTLRKRVLDIYFFECLGWVCFYLYEYFKSDSEESRYKNKMSVVRYLLDSLVSHNEFSRKLFHIDPKISCLIGLVSSCINVHLIWK